MSFVTINPEKSSASKGTVVHGAIREQLGERLAIRYGSPVPVRLLDAAFAPYSSRSGIRGGGSRQGTGFIDLAFYIPIWKDMLLAEIKPANIDGVVNGKAQLDNYIQKANDSDEARREYRVSKFLPLPIPTDPEILRPVISRGRWFQIAWCYPGLILYKEMKKKKGDDEKDEKDKRGTARGLKLQAWTPEQLRRDIEAGTLQDGVYRNRYQAAWPSGERTNVVVWAKTGAGARDVQYYQEFPESVEFYARFGRASGLWADDSDRIRRTMIDYNRDLWSLIVDRETGRPTGRTPEIARAELRGIYGNILKGTFEAAARIMGAGAGITSVANAMVPRGGGPRPVTPDSRSTPSREAPMPGWVGKAVDKGAEEFFRQFERELQGAR